MRLTTDDDTASVDSTFLGPAGYTLPWEARFSAYGIGLVAAVAAVVVEHRAHMGHGLWTVVFTLVGVVAFTRWVGQYVNFEVPIRAVLVIFAHELTAPRPPTTSHRGRFTPSRVAINRPPLSTRAAAWVRRALAPTNYGVLA